MASVNGKDGIVALTAADIGLGSVQNVEQLPLSCLDTDGALAANSDSKVASQKAVKTYVNANSIPPSRTVNGKALSQDITLAALDIGLSNVTNTAQIPISYLDTDGALAANSDSKVASQKAVKSYVDEHASSAVVSDTLPIGTIVEWASDIMPANYLLCDGQAVSRATYSELFAKIGTTYGPGDGSATFNVPNIKGRVPVGKDSSQTEFDALNKTGGNKNLQQHNHTINHNHGSALTNEGDGAHNHTIAARNDYYAGGYNGVVASAASYETAGLTRTSGAHTHTFDMPEYSGNSGNAGTGDSGNLQPYIVLNYMIKAQNAVPSSRIDTDGTLLGNSDESVPSQKAVKTYSDTKIPLSFLDTDGTLAANSDLKIATQKAMRTFIEGRDLPVLPGAQDANNNIETGIYGLVEGGQNYPSIYGVMLVFNAGWYKTQIAFAWFGYAGWRAGEGNNPVNWTNWRTF